MSKDVSFPPNNGAVLDIAQIMKTVMSSDVEAEIGAMYVNARKAILDQKIINEMGHCQPRNPMQNDNSSVHSVITNNVQPKHTKAKEMSLYLIEYAHNTYDGRTRKIPLEDTIVLLP